METLQDMDAEEAHKQLQLERSRCRFLEVDIEMEKMRATKYRSIVLPVRTLAGEAGEDSSGASRPGASRTRHADRSVLTRPTLPAADVRCSDL